MDVFKLIFSDVSRPCEFAQMGEYVVWAVLDRVAEGFGYVVQVGWVDHQAVGLVAVVDGIA